MRLMKIAAFLCVCGAAAMPQFGCRSVGEATGMPGAKPKYGIVWNAPMEDLTPPGPERRTVYVTYRDMSGEDIQLREHIREIVRNQGWIVTSDSDAADYHLRTTLRFFGENLAGDGGHSASNALGGIYRHPLHDPLATRVSGAERVQRDGFVRSIQQNFSRSVEWNMIVDVVLAQRFEGGVVTDVAGSRERQLNTGAQMNTGGGHNSGSQTDRNETRQSAQRVDDHMQFAGRLTAWAAQWSMDKDEARQILEPRLIRALSNAVPAVN
jgi:hypothetical protein